MTTTFAVWAPYCTDADALKRRSDVRPEHLEGIKRIAAQGLLKLGGPTADPESGAPTGSMFIMEAENIAALRRDVLEKDPYWLNNVWDKEKLEVKLVTLVPINQAAQ